MKSDFAAGACIICGFTLYHPLLLPLESRVGVYSDARFPGRLLVALPYHRDHLYEVEADDLSTFMGEVQLLSRSLMKLTGVERVNLAILGNTESHVHAHLIPRYATDPNPLKSPWDDPRERLPLEKTSLDEMKENITDLVHHTLQEESVTSGGLVEVGLTFTEESGVEALAKELSGLEFYPVDDFLLEGSDAKGQTFQVQYPWHTPRNFSQFKELLEKMELTFPVKVTSLRGTGVVGP